MNVLVVVTQSFFLWPFLRTCKIVSEKNELSI